MSISKVELEFFYKEHGAKLYNFALRWVFNPELAEEIVQEAIIKSWQKHESLNLLGLKSYLYKTIQNLAINHKRKEVFVKKIWQVMEYALGTYDFVETDKEIEKNQEFKEMKAQLDKIPQPFREVLLMSYYSEMSHAEIAKVLNIAEGTVASRKNRALKILTKECQMGGLL